MDAEQPLDGALDPQEKLKKRSQNTFICSGNTSSLSESVLITFVHILSRHMSNVFTDTRVIYATTSFEKAE